MIVSKALRAIMEAAKETDEYWMDSAKLDFAIAIEAKRREAGKSYADLARTMNTSNAYISKVFRGDANLTIESMVKLSRAVGCNISIKSNKDIRLNLISDKDDASIKVAEVYSAFRTDGLSAVNDMISNEDWSLAS